MKKSTKKKLKKMFSLYNIAIIVCVVAILASVVVLIKPDVFSVFKSEKNVSEANVDEEYVEDEEEEEVETTKTKNTTKPQTTNTQKTNKSTKNKAEDTTNKTTDKKDTKKKESTKSVERPTEAIETGVDSDKKIDEDEAAEIAIKQFDKLGEKDLKKEDLQILKIKRGGTEYYYISSKENTVEISMIGGEITRINSVVVDK